MTTVPSKSESVRRKVPPTPRQVADLMELEFADPLSAAIEIVSILEKRKKSAARLETYEQAMSVIRAACQHYGLTQTELATNTAHSTARRRRLVWALMRHRVGCSYALIARLFQRTYQCVSNGAAAVDLQDPDYVALVQSVDSAEAAE